MAPSGGWCLSVFSVCADETEPTAQQRAVAIKSFLNKIHPRFWFDEIAKILRIRFAWRAYYNLGAETFGTARFHECLQIFRRRTPGRERLYSPPAQRHNAERR